MKKVIIVGVIVLFAVVLGVWYMQSQRASISTSSPSGISPSPLESSEKAQSDISQTTVLAKNLDTPWAIAFLPASQGEPDKSMLVTERPGRVRVIDSNGILNSSPITIPGVKEIGEGGLLGIAVDPDFLNNHFVYLYYTYLDNGSLFNKVVRFQYSVSSLAIACPENSPCSNAATPHLSESKVIVDKIPSSSNHNGGRIKFGPDGYLYITTGDAENPSQAQDVTALGGKILRVTDAGAAVSGNPFHNLVYSYGHRNPQGLAWDSSGALWATEHGRSTPTGFDEINRIEIGKNYGWPTIQGDEVNQGMVTPKRNSGATTTWAPSGAVFVGSSLFFAGLRGQTLYEAVIQNNQVIEIKEHFKGQYGRLREVVLGSDGMLYITTSNRDGRGNPDSIDDRIIRVNPQKL